MANAEMRGYADITPAMSRLFAYLAGKPIAISDLARKLSVSRQAVHKLALEASRLGYVEFMPSSDDARLKLLKFTAKGQVCLRVWQTGDRLHLEVHDTGRGIAPERQVHIFNRFEHADVQTNRAYGGTGLGLTICDKLVHLFGGQIGVRSTPGQGSVFWLVVPFAPAHDDASAQQDAGADLRTDQPLDILVVDDNAVNLMVARLQLQKTWAHARITTAGSGAEALQLLDTQGFDVALVDMVMPEMDGTQLTQQIRQRIFPPARLPGGAMP